MIRNPRRADRPRGRLGVTLTEVLVAMFVMAIGMISLLTLFPLGAMQVGQALRDDRATQLARQADAYLRQTWRTEVVTNNGNNEGYFWAMDDPNLFRKVAPILTSPPVPRNVYRCVYLGPNESGRPVTDQLPSAQPASPQAATPFAQYLLTGDTAYTGTPAATPAAIANEIYSNLGPSVQSSGSGSVPSYPVMIDPIGYSSRPSTKAERVWVARDSASTTTYAGLLMPRRTVQSVISTPTLTFDLCTLTDDMAFNANGAPVGGSELGRQGRYSWSAVVQRPDNGNRLIANLSVLVFDKRPSLPQLGDETVIAPDDTPAFGTRTVKITLPNRTGDTSPVLLKRGGWIIDGTIDAVAVADAVNFPKARRNFFAYRVSGFTETVGTTTTQYEIDLETPLKADLTASSQLYLFAGLIEVYTRPQLRPDSPY